MKGMNRILKAWAVVLLLTPTGWAVPRKNWGQFIPHDDSPSRTLIRLLKQGSSCIFSQDDSSSELRHFLINQITPLSLCWSVRCYFLSDI